MTIDELIARLETATEGSRELDVYIHAALHPDQRTLLDPGSVVPPMLIGLTHTDTSASVVSVSGKRVARRTEG